mgnify:CR=1 FL=1
MGAGVSENIGGLFPIVNPNYRWGTRQSCRLGLTHPPTHLIVPLASTMTEPPGSLAQSAWPRESSIH